MTISPGTGWGGPLQSGQVMPSPPLQPPQGMPPKRRRRGLVIGIVAVCALAAGAGAAMATHPDGLNANLRADSNGPDLPVKFAETIQEVIGSPPTPARFAGLLDSTPHVTELPDDASFLKDWLAAWIDG